MKYLSYICTMYYGHLFFTLCSSIRQLYVITTYYLQLFWDKCLTNTSYFKEIQKKVKNSKPHILSLFPLTIKGENCLTKSLYYYIPFITMKKFNLCEVIFNFLNVNIFLYPISFYMIQEFVEQKIYIYFVREENIIKK